MMETGWWSDLDHGLYNQMGKFEFIILSKNQQAFSVKGQVVNILGFTVNSAIVA